MLDFIPVRNREITYAELAETLSIKDLRDLTNEMIDKQLALVAGCTDADVTFVPDDPDAHDPYAENPEDEDIAWTLGHLIVHVTASSEEAAFMAAELARGVPYEKRRSRSEVPWETVTTIEKCRQRLEESRRMRLASLDIWPDDPFLDNTFPSEYWKCDFNATVRFIHGLSHDDGHLAQIGEVARQAKGQG